MITEDATHIGISGKHVSYTSNHWTGPNNEAYTTVTAHYIDAKVWEMKLVCRDFKLQWAHNRGKLHNDIQDVLSKFMVEGKAGFVQVTWANLVSSCVRMVMNTHIAQTMCSI